MNTQVSFNYLLSSNCAILQAINVKKYSIYLVYRTGIYTHIRQIRAPVFSVDIAWIVTLELSHKRTLRMSFVYHSVPYGQWIYFTSEPANLFKIKILETIAQKSRSSEKSIKWGFDGKKEFFSSKLPHLVGGAIQLFASFGRWSFSQKGANSLE